ncbi:MAG: hypothetical protein AAB456_01615, partial [Patescibacteria group bacterium]
KITKEMFGEADKLRGELSKGTLDWRQAWNRLKSQFPSVPDNQIDSALGGSAGYNPQTGAFEKEKATGFAREGARAGTEAKYSTRPVGDETKFYYGNQEITPEQYHAGTSKAEGAVISEQTGEQKLISVLDQYKSMGFKKGDIKKLLKDKYGSVPDVAADWIDENY